MSEDFKRQKFFLVAIDNVKHIITMWKIGDKILARPEDQKDKYQEFKILNSPNKQISRFFRGGCEILKFKDSVNFEPLVESEPPEIVQKLILNQKKAEQVFIDFKLAVKENDISELRTILEMQEN